MDEQYTTPVYLLPIHVIAESYAAEMLLAIRSGGDELDAAMAHLVGVARVNAQELRIDGDNATAREYAVAMIGGLAGALLLVLQLGLQRRLRRSWQPVGFGWVERLVRSTAALAAPRIRRNTWADSVSHVEE